MSDAPERIWLWYDGDRRFVSTPLEPYPKGSVEYVRADIAEAKLAKAETRLEWVRTQEETPPFISMIVADTLKELGTRPMSDLDRVAREILAQQRAERDELGEVLLNALRDGMPWGLTVDLGNERSAELMRMNGSEAGSKPYRPTVSPDGSDPAAGDESPVALRDWQIVFDWKLENCDQDHIEMTVHITGGGGFV